MNENIKLGGKPSTAPDSGLAALCAVAQYYRIPAEPGQIAFELDLHNQQSGPEDLVRAAGRLGLKARIISGGDVARFTAIPAPAIFQLKNGEFALFGGRNGAGQWRIIDPVTRSERSLEFEALNAEIQLHAILITKRLLGPGIDPRRFGFRWFLPSLWRYRRSLSHVLLSSFFIQILALVTPLFFQVIVDKVISHRSNSTLLVLIAGLMLVGLFDILLQYLRAYALSHTSNRIDVELGQRLFHHLFRLPLAYFETRPAGQTVARIRELENIRQFLTGQGLFSALDLLFAFVFIAIMFFYSWQLTLIVLLSVPIYVLIAAVVRTPLREVIAAKFNRGAESQQFLVESIVGAYTIKSAAVEPSIQRQWEEKLAAYVTTAFRATMLAAGGQSAIQYVNRITTALVLLFGAWAVMDGTFTLGQLIAFNMIATQMVQPILRLSQLWQDFQQIQISVERLGDILNFPSEYRPQATPLPPRPRGRIEFQNVSFRYNANSPDVLRSFSIAISPGESIGIVGPSGSGKSTVAKLIQRLYLPDQGRILLDGSEISQNDPAWLRRNVGVVLQESILFNGSIHENIAFAAPGLHRSQIIALSKLSGAHEFITKLPAGYDTVIEERGANLSGGQRQRIAIARALAVNPPILIFDEATSALDYESERLIQANMSHIIRNRTVLIIAHRLAAVRSCDRIISMVDGRVIEAGTHDQLLNNQKGLYAHLWRLQTAQDVR